MDLKDFTDLGKDIGRRVNSAIYNMNFDQLNRDIRNKVDQAFGTGSAGDFGGLNGKLYHGEEEERQQTYAHRSAADKKTGSSCPFGIPIMEKIPGKISGMAMMIIGYSVAAIFALTGSILGITGLAMSSVDIPAAGFWGAEAAWKVALAAAAGMIPLTAAGLITGILGTGRYTRVKRFWKYIRGLKGGNFCSVSQLAKEVKKSPRYTAKDLEDMIKRGFFLQGHLDDQKTCFIGDDRMYEQYLLARDSAAQSAGREAGEEKQTSADPDSGSSIEDVIREGNAYIKTIREANDAIYDREISEKLYRMEHIVKKIFCYVSENPEQVDQLRRFMSYYMPTTEKLVNAYKEMDSQSIRGANIEKAKSEIAQTLDTINEAYEKLYDSMYVDVAMDVSSDIAVLKTLFAQEGLTKEDMKGGKKN